MRDLAIFLVILFLFNSILNQCNSGFIDNSVSGGTGARLKYTNFEKHDLYAKQSNNSSDYENGGNFEIDLKESLSLTNNIINNSCEISENFEQNNFAGRSGNDDSFIKQDTVVDNTDSLETIRGKNVNNYFNFSSHLKNNVNQSEAEEIVIKLKYPNIFEEMVIVKYNNGNIFYPVFEILSLMKLNHAYDILNKVLEGSLNNGEKDRFKLDFMNKKLVINSETVDLEDSDLIEGEFEYFISSEILNKSIGLTVEFNMSSLSAKVKSDYLPPIAERIRNEKKLAIYKNNTSYESYPLLYDRERKNINGGFLDYSLSANYLKNESPYYSIDAGLGAELLGGDVQVNSQQSIFNGKITYNQIQYKWRYAYLNNNYLSNISLGHNNADGLQSYQVKGLHISNEPLEPRKLYDKNQLTGKTNPNYKVEIYQNGQIIDIVDADGEGNYYFDIPFTYGTTLLELHEIGPNGEYKIENKIYQIPIEQIPEGNLEYNFNLGQLSNDSEYFLNSNAAYGINEWLTSEIGTDIFLNDFINSSLYNNTTARIYEGNLLNLVIAPNAFNSLSFNSIFPNLASINLNAKFYEENEKINPAKIKNAYEGNIFFPVKLDDYLISFLLRGRESHYSNSQRSEITFRTFLNYKNISPSVELSYYGLDNNNRLYESTLLNLRMNYSFYVKSAIFSGNIVDARFIYDLVNKKGQSMSLTLSTTLLRQLRLQLAYINNFINSNSELQLRVVLDLPTFRSQTTATKNVLSNTMSGSINYDRDSDRFTYYNRSMLGRSAAKFKFFVDGNSNKMFDEGELLISDMDVQINSIGRKQKYEEGEIIINDLESYSKYNVKLIDKKSKNPLYFPYQEKFSFVSDPHQFKQIEIPFFEAAEASGSIYRRSDENLLPVSGVKVIFQNIISDEETVVRSMSDGTFYHYGLKPGEYKVFIDPEQLKRMRLKSNPQIINVVFKSISEEEYFIEHDFILE